MAIEPFGAIQPQRQARSNNVAVQRRLYENQAMTYNNALNQNIPENQRNLQHLNLNIDSINRNGFVAPIIPQYPAMQNGIPFNQGRAVASIPMQSRNGFTNPTTNVQKFALPFEENSNPGFYNPPIQNVYPYDANIVNDPIQDSKNDFPKKADVKIFLED